MKVFRTILSVMLALCLTLSLVPAYAIEAPVRTADTRGIHNSIIIDDDATGGYEGDYVVIYNPSTSSSTSYSTGTLTGLIETTVNPSVSADPGGRRAPNPDQPFYKIDVDPLMAEIAKTAEIGPEPEPVRASYSVGSTKTFSIYSAYSPTGSGSVQFECLYVGQHCYIWTPTSSANNTYPLDEIDSSFAKMAADEFDSKFDLMQSSFGNHTNGSSGDGKLHMLYYNINDGWQPGQGYVAGFFYNPDISNNGLPILNIDTYPGVYYKNTTSGNEYKRMDDTYGTMVHEYQHLINYSNTSGMATWLNECFSAAAEEICYPGSSVVGRIQSWENYYYSDNNDWLTPPAEFEYSASDCPNLHQGYSLYAWNNNIDDILALYSQVSFFAQYLYTRFGNTIYRQISNKYSSSETSAITSATGVSCADLARDFRVAVTANAAQDQYGGIYGFKAQDGYNPSTYHDVQNPWDLLSPVVFTGTSCSIKGGGAITVKPVGGVYNPPSGASSNLKYIGIKLASPYTITAVSNNETWGTVSVDGTRITATPADGYYVSGYEVTEGTATAVIAGNIITVTPESDCTIQVIFAPKPTYTVRFVACGADQGSQTAYVGDAITLPATAPDAEGWTFSGWVENTVAETTDKPAYYAPGATYTVTGNVTLYALYTRTEGGGSETVYQLLTAAPSDWAGNYVITNNGTGSSTSPVYVLKGVTPGSNGAQIENASNCSKLDDSGIVQNDDILTNVATDYVFALAANGSYYTVQSASTGTYIGMNSSSYMSGYTAINTSYCRWTPAINASGIAQLKNAANGSYPYLGFSASNGYFWSASTSNANVLKLWKETEIPSDITYYTTDPVVTPVHEHTMTQVAAVAATCTEPGNIEYWYCAGCDKYFTDAEGENEITQAETVIPATGHTPGEAVKENEVAATCETAGSYDSVVYCTVCGAEISRETVTVPAIGHNWGEPAYVWSEDNSTVTATRICANDASHVETETVTTTQETNAATCEDAGEVTYTATFENTAFETQTRTEAIPATGHTPGEAVIENNVEPTCTEAGSYDEVVYCTVCGAEISRNTVTIPATGHTPGETVIENNVAPTCETAGSYDEVVYCTVCGAELSRNTVTVAALGHDWGEPTYTWAEENNGWKCTAERICQRDESHAETETVTATYTVIQEPTTTEEGKGLYTAVFENEAFETQTKEVTIDMLPIEGYHIIVTDYTNSNATTSIVATQLYSGEVTFTVTCGSPCVVAIDNGDDTYTRLTCTTNGDTHSFTVTVTDADVTIIVAIKGDADLNGVWQSKDATMMAQAIAGKRTFTTLQQLVCDGDGNGVFNSKDATFAAQVVAGKRSYVW